MLRDQLEHALKHKGLSIYGAAQIVADADNVPLKTVHRRIVTYLAETPPQSIAVLEATLNALGYEIVLVEK